MPVEIRNLTHRPVLMRLNSGTSLHLSPGALSAAIGDHEIINNMKVKKLQGRHVIALEPVQKKSQKTATPKKTNKPGKRK